MDTLNKLLTKMIDKHIEIDSHKTIQKHIEINSHEIIENTVNCRDLERIVVFAIIQKQLKKSTQSNFLNTPNIRCWVKKVAYVRRHISKCIEGVS